MVREQPIPGDSPNRPLVYSQPRNIRTSSIYPEEKIKHTFKSLGLHPRPKGAGIREKVEPLAHKSVILNIVMHDSSFSCHIVRDADSYHSKRWHAIKR